MPLFAEIESASQTGGLISGIEPGSVAAEIGLQVDDVLLGINDQDVVDVIDVQFYSAEESLELLVRRGDEYLLFEAEREYNQPLGLTFAHPTFDVDIRRCNNLCEFCFVLQMAPSFRRTLYIKDDDYRYSFLFGHYVTLTNLSEHDWWRIETMRLSPLYVSVHVTDLEMRRNFLRNPSAPDIVAQLRWLADRGIEIHTQLVIVPEFNDGIWLERSIETLEDLWPAVRSVSVVPVGLTRHHKYRMRPHTREEASVVLDYVESLQPAYLARYGVRFVYPTDEWYLVTGREVPDALAYDGQQLEENGLGMVRRFLDEWEAIRDEIAASLPNAPNYASITMVTGTMFGQLLGSVADEFGQMTGILTEVKPIVNRRLGDTITAAGLLMGEDILTQLKETGKGSLVVLPRVTFDHPDLISLDDITPQEMADELGVPVVLADGMGDVWDALSERSKLTFLPDSGA